MPTREPKTTDYSIQAVVIPRGYDPAQNELSLCLAFAVVPPTAGVVTIPNELKDWPTLVHRWLSSANLLVDGAAHRFQRWLPRDMEGWNLEDSQTAWSKLFDKIPFGKVERRLEPATATTPQPLDQFKTVYDSPDLRNQIAVNPPSASDLKPANRFEAPNPIVVSDGLTAEHFRRIREDNAVVRADLDARYVAALAPDRLRDSVTAFVGKIRQEPRLYEHLAAAALPALVALVADPRRVRALMAALPPSHRANRRRVRRLPTAGGSPCRFRGVSADGSTDSVGPQSRFRG